ncbi:MAG: CAP domain-containing protein [Anaerolineae bacterium]|nr:CAP domain-containing protein [Anaerolineae bacterium]MCO5199045.1 CAP domain-containing protein [Anaerolineae bacterium]
MLQRTITALLLACLAFIFVGRISAESTGHDQLIAALNSERSAAALPTVTFSPVLASVAQLQANYMAGTASVTHYGAAGGSVASRAQTVGYSGEVNEIIFGGVADPDGIVKWWMGSDAHWPIILNPAFSQAGVATATNAETGWTYWCVVFGAPAGQRSADVALVSVERVDAAVTQSVPEPVTVAEPAAPAPTTNEANAAPVTVQNPPQAPDLADSATVVSPIEQTNTQANTAPPAAPDAAEAVIAIPEPVAVAEVAPAAQLPAVVTLGGVGGLTDVVVPHHTTMAEETVDSAESYQQASMSLDPVHIAIAGIALIAAGLFITIGYLKPRRNYDPFRRHY